MKNLKHIYTGMTVLGSISAMLGATLSQPKVAQNPIVNFSNTTTIDIQKVELSDSATKVYVQAHFRPHFWIKIASETYLNADGKKFALTGAENIVPDSLFWMPDSGVADFTLSFEPLPLSTTSFDFIEGDEDGAFKLWNVDISGKEVAEFPDGLPSEMKSIPEAETIPDPAFEVGETTVRIHLLPYIKELTNSASLYVDGMDGTQNEYTVNFDDKGEGSVSFKQYGTANAFLVDPKSFNLLDSYTFYPGEKVDCYVDLRQTGYQTMANRNEGPHGKVARNLHNGKYNKYDKLNLNSNSNFGHFRLNLHSGDFADYHMTGEEYKAMVKSKYEALSDSISKLEAPHAVKDLKLIKLQNEVLEAMADYRYLLEHNYRKVHDAWRERELPSDSIPGKLTDQDLAEVATWFEINNPKLLMDNQNIGIIDWNALGVNGDLSKSMNLFINKASLAKKTTLTEEDIEELKSLSNPFFSEACMAMLEYSKRALNQINSVESFRETPNVAEEEIFDAIISEHKGKVVMVDLWNTWCGPCRSAIKANEPLKDAELSDKDIVWIYIADESSDPNKYLEMIPNIRGIHYKLTRPQIEKIRERFEVDGIPYYILVDREGKATGRPDLRDHNKYIKAIKELL